MAVIWPLVRAAIYTGLGAVQLAADVYDRARPLVRRLAGVAPKQKAPQLPHRDAERIADFGRCAGHESEPRCSTIRPPR